MKRITEFHIALWQEGRLIAYLFEGGDNFWRVFTIGLYQLPCGEHTTDDRALKAFEDYLADKEAKRKSRHHSNYRNTLKSD
jgi:hypothetical protein